MNGEGVDDPLTQPSPPQGGEGFIGSSPLPVGEGWVRAFLVSFLPFSPRRRGPRPFHSSGNRTTGPLPRNCEAQRAEATQGNIHSGPCQSPGLLRFARNDAGMGRWVRVLFSFSRFPREGGDPEHFTQAETGPPTPRLRGEHQAGQLYPPPAASVRGASRRSNLGQHPFRPVSVPWVASLRSL